MKYRVFGLLAISTFIFLFSCKQEINIAEQKDAEYLIAFYNVENLFDTIDDPKVDDEEFLPNSKVSWTKKRYKHKLENLTKALSTLDGKSLPVMIGLCEVENKKVLFDLIGQKPLDQAGYYLLHKDSPDKRGIDVALLFHPEFFKPKYVKFMPIHFPFDQERDTRDILYAKGLVGKDTAHIFVNHWTSRWGGQEKTEAHRVFIAELIKSFVDSIQSVVKNPNIIIMGDLNDNPDNISMTKGLEAKKMAAPIKKAKLYNLGYNDFLDGHGSLYWKSWDMFDQFVVSGSLLNTENTFHISPFKQFIHNPDWILHTDKNGLKRPNRTKGKSYYGGFSDHLPVFIRVDAKLN
jgi:Endonuclease/Exonuclease/phosphatase family